MKIASIFTSPGLLNSDVSMERITYIFKCQGILEEYFLAPLTIEYEGGTFLLNVRNHNPGTQRNNPGDFHRQYHCCRNFRTRKPSENIVMNFVQFFMNITVFIPVFVFWISVMNNTYQREGHGHCNLKQTNKIPYKYLLEMYVIFIRGFYKHDRFKQLHHCAWTKYLSIVTFDKLKLKTGNFPF